MPREKLDVPRELSTLEWNLPPNKRRTLGNKQGRTMLLQ